MPRPAAGRNFGFRAQGLVRILTAADPDEVLTALEILGISPERPPTFEEAVTDLVTVAVGHVAKWVGPLNDLLEVVVELDGLASVYSQEREPSPAFDHVRDRSNAIRSLVIESMEEFKDMREEFTARMLAAKVQNPEFAWPPMPGIDPQL